MAVMCLLAAPEVEQLQTPHGRGGRPGLFEAAQLTALAVVTSGTQLEALQAEQLEVDERRVVIDSLKPLRLWWLKFFCGMF